MEVKMQLKIPSTVKVLQECWCRAEQSVRSLIHQKYDVHDEVFISRLFYGELKYQIEQREKSRHFKRAFAHDLRAKLGDQLSRGTARLAENMVVKVSYHEPHIEKKTGGDLGLVLVRPEVAIEPDRLRFTESEQGLLCQAKRQSATNGALGELKLNQRKVLKKSLGYTAFLLYMYQSIDESLLAPFAWLLGANNTLREIERSFKRLANLHPQKVSEIGERIGQQVYESGDILARLAEGSIGTHHQSTIKEQICLAPFFKLEIKWGKKPPSDLPLRAATHAELLVHN
jgi:hypothetical protein